MIRRLTKELELDIPHFGEPFGADEADIDSTDRIKLAKRVVNRASEFW